MNVKEYTYIGVKFDHGSKTVVAADKITSKMSRISQKIPIQFRDLEKLVGRLVFCAGVSRIPLVKYHFALKYVRRIFNKFNRGEIDISSTVSLPRSVVTLLNMFIAAVKRPLLISPNKSTSTSYLFSDASLQGWGAVLVDGMNRIRVLGARWTKAELAMCDSNINVLEALAVKKALQGFDLQDHHGNDLAIFVDNTSVQASLLKGNTSSSDLAPVIDECASLLCSFGTVRIGYIRSAENPADFPSRNFALSADETRAVGGGACKFLSAFANDPSPMPVKRY